MESEEESKKPNKRHKSCRRDVGTGGDFGGKKKKCRQERIHSVAADPDSIDNSKEAEREAQGTHGLIVRTVQVEKICLLCYLPCHSETWFWGMGVGGCFRRVRAGLTLERCSQPAVSTIQAVS